MEDFSKSDFLLFGFLGLAGGLLGFGLYGTAQAAAVGAGIGLVAIPALLLALFLYVTFF